MKPSVGFLFTDVARLFRRALNRQIRDSGVTALQWRVLAYINRYPAIIQSHLAEYLEVEPITLSRMIDRLTDAGLVQREPCAKDRRANRLHLTEKSQPLIAHLQEEAEALEAEIFAGMTADRKAQAIEILQQIHERLSSRDQSAEGLAADRISL